MGAGDPSPPDDQAAAERRPGDLFRPQAVAEQQGRWLGTVLLAPRVSHTVYTGFTALVVAGVLGLFAFGEYTRKARIGGWLAPEQGLIHIVAPQPGVLIRVHAQEGLEVTAGTPLAVISTERQSEALGATKGEVVRQLRAQRDSLRAERGRHEGLFAQAAATLAQRLVVTEAEARDLGREVALRRSNLHRHEPELRVANLTLDPVARRVSRGDRVIELTPKEYALLRYLMENAGTVLSRSQILNNNWGYGFDPGTKVVDVYIRYLRKKVDEGEATPLIHTIRGAGYCIGYRDY